MSQAIDQAPLTSRYWNMTLAILLSQMLEFFDFFVIGFVVALIAKPWHLTFGQSSLILLSSGVGAIVGSVLWGWLADKYGRRPMLIAAVLVFAIGTGAAALTPVGAWGLLAALRGIVGIGVGGGNVAGPPLVIEFTPVKYRTLLGGLATVTFIPLGTLLTSLVAATLSDAIGFRGLLALGLVPALLAIWAAFAVPESPRWLADQGRGEEARAAVSRIFRIPESSMLVPERTAPDVTEGTYKNLYRYRRSFWAIVVIWLFADTVAIGLSLWGPTLFTEVIGVSTSRAAFLFIFVSIGGIVGRIGFSGLAQLIGRRGTGTIAALCAAILLIVAALVHSFYIGAASAFFIGMVIVYVFADGQWGNLVPFTSEVWPVRMRTHGTGLANAMGGIGKIIGPVVLALIAGTGNLVTPEATTSALMPTFILLAVLMLAVAAAFAFIAPEPHGRSLDEFEAELEAAAASGIAARNDRTADRPEPARTD
jgi:putative MFS transporter